MIRVGELSVFPDPIEFLLPLLPSEFPSGIASISILWIITLPPVTPCSERRETRDFLKLVTVLLLIADCYRKRCSVRKSVRNAPPWNNKSLTWLPPPFFPSPSIFREDNFPLFRNNRLSAGWICCEQSRSFWNCRKTVCDRRKARGAIGRQKGQSFARAFSHKGDVKQFYEMMCSLLNPTDQLNTSVWECVNITADGGLFKEQRNNL